MHIPLVAQNCSKHLPFLLMSEYFCLLITLFHVLLSVPACALKSPGRTIDSANITFCKARPTASTKGWYCASLFGAYTWKMHSDCSHSLNLKRQNFPLSDVRSVTQWGRRGLTKMPTLCHTSSAITLILQNYIYFLF